MKPQAGVPPEAKATPVAIASAEQTKAFLSTLRGLSIDERKSYVQQHQDLAMQTWHSPDPGIADEYTKLMTQAN